MPADDNPLDPPSDDQKAPEPAASTDIAAVVQLVNDATAPLIDQMERLTASQQQSNENIATMMRQNQPPADPTIPVDSDLLTELTSGNGEAVIRKLVDEQVRNQLQTLTPVMANIVQSGATAFTNIEAQEIEEKYGSGAWDKFFKTPMEAIMGSYAKTNPALMADSATIRKEVNGLKGQVFDELVEHRDSSIAARSTSKNTELGSMVDGITQEVHRRVNGTGGIRAISGAGTEISEGLRGYLEERQRSIGVKETPKDFISRTGFGNSIDDFLDHKKKANGDAR